MVESDWKWRRASHCAVWNSLACLPTVLFFPPGWWRRGIALMNRWPMPSQMCFYMLCMLRCWRLFQFQQGLRQLKAAHVPNGTLCALYLCHMAMRFPWCFFSFLEGLEVIALNMQSNIICCLWDFYSTMTRNKVAETTASLVQILILIGLYLETYVDGTNLKHLHNLACDVHFL